MRAAAAAPVAHVVAARNADGHAATWTACM